MPSTITNSLSHKGGLRRKFMQSKLNSAVDKSNSIPIELESNAIEWCTLFRRNWEIYAELILGVALKPFQRQALHEIGVSDVYFWRASRGTSKSFVTALAAIIKLMLYPNSWIVVTATTSDQANKIVEDKILAELILKLSPYLLYFYQKEWIVITKPSDCYIIKNTLNGSTLKVLAPVQSSKGSRSSFTIYDEAAIMSKKDIDDIFEGMLYPRQAVYMNNPLYSKNKRWVEESKSIYLTSSYYSFLWWYKTWKDCVTGYYMDKRTKYGVNASDFFISIDNNLKTWGDYRKGKATMGDLEFRMNYLNEAVGNSADAFFSLETFNKNRTMKTAFIPPTPTQMLLDEFEFSQKNEYEVRLVVSDFAWTTTTGANKSDNSVAMCIKGVWNKDHFVKYVEYIELLPTADDADGCARRLQELYRIYQADYLVADARSGGEAIMASLSKQYEGDFSARIDIRGLTVADENEYQVATSDKIQYYKMRCVDPNAEHCVIPFFGSATTNTAYWKSTKRALERSTVNFLVPMSDETTRLSDEGEYYKMSAEELANAVAPFGQTDALIIEAVNLKTEIKNDQIKLEELPNSHKDRIVTLAMGLYIFDKIETAWCRQSATTVEDLSDFQIIY